MLSWVAMIQGCVLTANLASDFCYANNFVQLFACSWQTDVYGSSQPMSDKRPQHGRNCPSESCSSFPEAILYMIKILPLSFLCLA